MDVCKLNRTKKGKLPCRRKLRPLCPVNLFRPPQIGEDELGKEIQRYAIERVEKLPKRPDIIFYDVNVRRIYYSSSTGEDWAYVVALQLYEKIR